MGDSQKQLTIFKTMKQKLLTILALGCLLSSCGGNSQSGETKTFPFFPSDEKPTDIPLSAATERMYDNYGGIRPEDNELFSNFKYTKMEGLDYHGGDGTISRRDPSRVIKANGKYYTYYTHRQTCVGPLGIKRSNDTIPSHDWDLAEVWYATSEDGFTWEEQGVAVPRPPKPNVGWRAVCTPDIFEWEGKYYLYYQAFNEAPGTRGDDCCISVSVSDSPDGPFVATNKKILDVGERDTWDQYAVQDPFPIHFNGQIYFFYKSDYNHSDKLIRAIGLARANHPLGPFTREPKNPVLNSGHEITIFPYREGLAAIAIRDGHERNTIQYSEDGVDFYIKSVVAMPPVGAGPYMPDSFTDPEFSNGITWGVCHNKHVKKNGFDGGAYSIIMRFDCDLSLECNDLIFKETELFETPEEQFRQALTPKQRKERIKSSKQ